MQSNNIKDSSIFKKYLFLAITITILCYLFRSSIPNLKYPFILGYLSLLFISILYSKGRIFDTLKAFLQTYYLLLIQAIILLFYLFFSDKIYLVVFKDVVNWMVLLSLFFLISSIIYIKKDLFQLIQYLELSIIVFAVIISVQRLLLIFNVFSPSASNLILGYTSNEVGIDYNFAILPVILGFVAILSILCKTNSIFRKLILVIILDIFSISVLFSGSRRGNIMLLMILIILIVIQTISIFKRNFRFRNLGHSSLLYFLSIIIIIILSYGFINFTTSKTKNEIIELTGSKDLLATKISIANQLFKLNILINKTTCYSDFYSKIWSSPFNPSDPESGWGNSSKRLIFPLIGKNVEIVPPGVKGFILDSTNFAIFRGNSGIYTVFKENLDIEKTDSLEATVFCYMSEDCNGTWARIVFESSNIGTIPGMNYDLSKSGTWQKLTCKVSKVQSKIRVLFLFSKLEVIDFTNLKGYIILAYPQITNFKLGESYSSYKFDRKRLNNCLFGNETMILNNNSDKMSLPNYSNRFGVLVESVSNSTIEHFPGLSSDYTIENYNHIKFTQATLFDFRLPLIQSIFLIGVDKDPIRRFVSKFISEDTTYHGYKQNLHIGSIKNDFMDLRLSLWQFAIQVFSKEYNFKQKVFGGGFNFLNWFSYYFSGDKTKSDYPHNPFLYILLYSGIVGLIIYCILLYKVCFFYLKYIKEFPILFIFFLITFFFSFFSAGSPLDPPIMGFFVIIPFFIHSIHERDKKHSLKPGIVE